MKESENRGESSTNPNNYRNQKRRALRRKLDLIKLKGNKCNICGYDKNLAALEFHHLDPTKKKFRLDSRVLSNKKWNEILEEAKKCILVCANCHRELHNPDLAINNVVDKLEKEGEEVLKQSQEERCRKQVECKHCGKPFDAVTGKIYCSKECRVADRNWPTKEQLFEKYKEVGSWDKVRKFLKFLEEP